jgi:hypothetical protein
MPNPVYEIDALVPMAFLDVSNTLNNRHWKFCADEVQDADGRWLRDDELTFEQFGDLGPNAMLPTGTRVVMPHLWGPYHQAGLTPATDFVITLPDEASVARVVYIILSQYHMAMQGMGASARFYYIEAVTRRPNGDVEIVWGT